jgi:hypothetical protein
VCFACPPAAGPARKGSIKDKLLRGRARPARRDSVAAGQGAADSTEEATPDAAAGQGEAVPAARPAAGRLLRGRTAAADEAAVRLSKVSGG